MQKDLGRCDSTPDAASTTTFCSKTVNVVNYVSGIYIFTYKRARACACACVLHISRWEACSGIHTKQLQLDDFCVSSEESGTVKYLKNNTSWTEYSLGKLATEEF